MQSTLKDGSPQVERAGKAVLPGEGFKKLDSHEFPLKGLLLRMWALGLP